MNKKTPNEALKRIDVAAFHESEKAPIVIVLDDIRSLNNIGSVFRTADAFRIEKIILCGITAQPPHRDIRKTALGATESVAWEYQEEVSSGIKKLKNEGFVIVALEQTEAAVLLNDFKIQTNQKYAIILGNEVRGVKQDVVDQSDFCVEIPQFGTKHSLNVSVSCGMIIWDLACKLGVLKTLH